MHCSDVQAQLIDHADLARGMSTGKRHCRHSSPVGPVCLCLVVVLALAGVGALQVTDDTFEAEVLDSSVPVLVDFWAPWCGPCKMIAPLVDEIARDFESKAKAVKINTDASPGVATKYGVRSIPTVMIFKGGQRQETIIGAVPKATLVQSLEKFI